VFLLFVFGLIQVARCIMAVHQLNNAARIGCRTAVIEGKSNSDVSTAVTTNLSGQGITGQTVTVLVNGATANASTAQAGDAITVQVSVPIQNVAWVPGDVGTLTGQYSLRRE
jgi:Flp pilus assembly protein TadG